MKNVKLRVKMLLLTAITVVTVVGVAWVGVNRLGMLNEVVREMVDRTLRKVTLNYQVREELLSAVRYQKNCVLSQDDKTSTEFAKLSEAAVVQADKLFGELQRLSNQDKQEDETAALADGAEKLKHFAALNKECVDLGVQNTNAKANDLCRNELKTAVEQVLALTDRVLGQGQTTAPGPGAKQAYAVARSTALLQWTLQQHIETTAGTPEFARLDKLVPDTLNQLKQQFDELAPQVPQTDAALLLGARTALNEISQLQTRIVTLSRQDTSNKAGELSATTARDSVNAAMSSLDKLAALLDAHAQQARANSVDAYSTGRTAIIIAALAGMILSVVASLLIARSVTLSVTRVRDLTKAMADGDLSHRIGMDQQDEVGELASAADSLACSLSTIVSEIHASSEKLGHS
ncbi:MAG: methyl-accepting chemotaxis protein, partial [Planctomycetia bacterium]|nr:methyl-accepting chemotaxis protein [Planctomycetia bacterium]